MTPAAPAVDSERLRRLGLQHTPWDGASPLPQVLQEAGCEPGCAVLVAAQGSSSSSRDAGLCVLQQEQLEASTPPGTGDLTTPLLQQVAHLNLARAQQQQQQQQQQQPDATTPPLLLVGYVMKASREKQLAEAGLLSTAPAGAADALLQGTQGSGSRSMASSSGPQGQQQQQQQQVVCFMPLDLEVDLEQQQPFHVLLHKGSDELVEAGAQHQQQQQQQPPAHSSSPGVAATTRPAAPAADASNPAPSAAVPSGGSSGSASVSGAGVAWSPRLAALQGWLAARPHLPVVDAFQHTAKVVDRRWLQSLLVAALPGAQLPAGVVARPPAAVVVDSWEGPGGVQVVEAAGVRPPFIIKPLAACGVASSHAMALVRGAGALGGLVGQQVAAPALVQEFANHGGVQAKVYVLGQQVFFTSRASIPDICCHQEGDNQEQVLLFDSLASLPTQLPSSWRAQAEDGAAAAVHEAPVSLEVLRPLAACLRQHLQLSLFGFDVVVSAGEYVVVDVNYFPNYRGGGPTTAAWFRDVMRQAHSQHHV